MAQENPGDADRQKLIRNFIKSKGNIFDDISDISELYDIKKNIKNNKMTKYQYTNVLGIRATQIAHGAHIKIEVTPDEITELFLTTTQPTEGFVLVFPKLTFAFSKANFKKLL